MMFDFPPVSKEDWLRQVAADLKDRKLEDFSWAAPDGTLVSPFVHADDFEHLPSNLYEGQNHWGLVEDIAVGDPVQANRQAIEALEGGADGLGLAFHQQPQAAELDALFQSVYLDFIALHLHGEAVANAPAVVLGQLSALAQKHGISSQALRGSVAYHPLATAERVDWRYLVEMFQYGKEQFPAFKLLHIAADTPEEALKAANTYLEKLSAQGVPTEDVAERMQFGVAVGKSYFWEIARLRAMLVLWLNFVKAWGLPLSRPSIGARFDAAAYTDDLYTNMIRATTMSMSAVLGGASWVSVLPYDSGREAMATYPPSFGRRMARNIQHLLKMESGFDEVPDPAAGSYYIETLTRQIAERAWAAFSKK
jgi:methylmalonyl-CoA mutase